jgi:hypothetical protein
VSLLLTEIAFSYRAQQFIRVELSKRPNGCGANTKISQSSVVCAEPLNVYWFTLDCGATLPKIISKRKRLECGSMEGEKRMRVNTRRERQGQELM